MIYRLSCQIVKSVCKRHPSYTHSTVDDINDLILKSEEFVKLAKAYFHKNGLILNANRTQCMFIGTRGLLSKIPPNTHVKVDGNVITPSTSLNNLGVHFDNHLMFYRHINEISKKVCGTILCQ